MPLDLDYRAFIAEAVGTFLLVLTVGLSSGEPLAVGGALWLGMCITGFRSGAQFNPAVTISVITKNICEGKTDKEILVPLILNIPVQISAGLVAGFTAWGIGKNTFYFEITDGIKLSQAFFCELLFTMLLCLNVQQAGKSRQGLFLEGGMIALTLTTCAFTIGHITRNCLNPAVEIGLNVADYANKHDNIKKSWLYVVAPILGGITAAIISKIRGSVVKAEIRQHRTSGSLYFELKVNK